MIYNQLPKLQHRLQKNLEKPKIDYNKLMDGIFTKGQDTWRSVLVPYIEYSTVNGVKFSSVLVAVCDINYYAH